MYLSDVAQHGVSNVVDLLQAAGRLIGESIAVAVSLLDPFGHDAGSSGAQRSG